MEFAVFEAQILPNKSTFLLFLTNVLGFDWLQLHDAITTKEQELINELETPYSKKAAILTEQRDVLGNCQDCIKAWNRLTSNLRSGVLAGYSTTSPHPQGKAPWGRGWFSTRRVSPFLTLGDFSRAVAFRSLYYPLEKMRDFAKDGCWADSLYAEVSNVILPA